MSFNACEEANYKTSWPKQTSLILLHLVLCRVFLDLKVSALHIHIKCDLSLVSDLKADVDSYTHHWEKEIERERTGSLLPALSLQLDLCSFFFFFFLPAPTRRLPAIPYFDLCYLALIFLGVSSAVIEGDGLNIRDWHFSVIWHHRRHLSVLALQVSCPLKLSVRLRGHRWQTKDLENYFLRFTFILINWSIQKLIKGHLFHTFEKLAPNVWHFVPDLTKY